MSHQKGVFALSIKNPITNTDSNLSKVKGGKLSESFLPSTKPDQKCHGYGLRSMDVIVKHYQGHLEISTADGVFELFLYLPASIGLQKPRRM